MNLNGILLVIGLAVVIISSVLKYLTFKNAIFDYLIGFGAGAIVVLLINYFY